MTRKSGVNSAVLVGAHVQAPPAPPVARPWQQASAVFAALGLAISVVAGLDLALAWLPFHFGNGEWEFGTVTRTLDSLALGTTGIVVLLVAVVARGVRWALAALAVVFVLAFVALILCLALYGLNVPVALEAVPAAAAPVLKRGIARTASFGLIYTTLYAWLGLFTWRAYRAESRARKA